MHQQGKCRAFSLKLSLNKFAYNELFFCRGNQLRRNLGLVFYMDMCAPLQAYLGTRGGGSWEVHLSELR